jgi:hypothetical protein
MRTLKITQSAAIRIIVVPPPIRKKRIALHRHGSRGDHIASSDTKLGITQFRLKLCVGKLAVSAPQDA